MATYLVDTENTQHWWSTCHDVMRAGDRIILFYTNNSNDLHFPLFDCISDLDIPVQFLKCACGSPNALDFQLSSYLGYLISRNPGETYYIIANDAGYDAAVAFWQHRGVDVLRVMYVRPGCLETMSVDADITAIRSDVLSKFRNIKSVRAEFDRVLPEDCKSELDRLCDIFQDVLKSARVSYRAIAFRNRLTKNYGLSRGSSLYNLLKPCVTDMFKSVPELSVGSNPSSTSHVKPDAAVASGDEQDTGISWSEFVRYVNSENVCAAYRRSVMHDFPFVTEKLGQQIMAGMAWAVISFPGTERIDRVMCFLKPLWPKNMLGSNIQTLRARFSRKMSQGVWPDFVDRHDWKISDLPVALR